MSAEKASYLLSGVKSQPPSWVQLQQQPVAGGESSMFLWQMPSSAWPLRYDHEIPLEWLSKRPDFYVLLRADTHKSFPEWVIPPARYALKQEPPSSEQRPLLFLAHHDARKWPSWDDLASRWPKREMKWFSYACRRNPDWPESARLMAPDLLLKVPLERFEIVDLNFWQGDTISHIHLHLLHNGSRFHVAPSEVPVERRVIANRECFYGRWEIYR